MGDEKRCSAAHGTWLEPGDISAGLFMETTVGHYGRWVTMEAPVGGTYWLVMLAHGGITFLNYHD